MGEILKDNRYLISRGSTFDELRNDQKHTDVVIATIDGTKFPCHKIILIGGCPFFRGLFASDMVESRQNEVSLNPIDISGSHFKKILKFIYTGEIKLNFEEAKAINIYAGLFTMTNLKNITELCLMTNITNETSLELWRHSEKYLNDKLLESCLSTANSEGFLDTHVENMTMEEIKYIVSLKKLNSKILLQNIVKWIKTDFADRQQYIKDLMGSIDFDDINDKEYQRQLFSDKILKENKEFLKLSIHYLLRSTKNVVGVPKKKLFVVTYNNIFYTNFHTKEFLPTNLRPENKSFATSCHSTNGFIITGGGEYNKVATAVTQFCPSANLKKVELSHLLEPRRLHRNYTVGTKIYTCGGEDRSEYNEGTNKVEIFEENAGVWIRGPAMNYYRKSFGAADDSENSLYAIGEGRGLQVHNYSVERFDIRMNSWQNIYSVPSASIYCQQSLYKDDKIYCFGGNYFYIFDIRTNKNFDIIPYKLDNNMKLEFVDNKFDCTFVDNDIWLIGKVSVNSSDSIPSAFRLDLQTNTWERKMFRGLETAESLGLVWC